MVHDLGIQMNKKNGLTKVIVQNIDLLTLRGHRILILGDAHIIVTNNVIGKVKLVKISNQLDGSANRATWHRLRDQ